MNTFTQPTDQHIAIEPTVLYVGTPVALLTSLNPDGSTNISPMSWAGPPPARGGPTPCASASGCSTSRRRRSGRRSSRSRG